jgi:thiol-disulfide isomerase/thioredoxin
MKVSPPLWFAIVAAGVGTVLGAGPGLSPVTWSVSAPSEGIAPGQTAEIEIDAAIDPGWHLYSATQPAGGPIRTQISLLTGNSLSAAGAVRQSPFSTEMDPLFHLKVESFSGHASFWLPVKAAGNARAGQGEAQIRVFYQVCNGRVCLEPTERTLGVDFMIKDAAVGKHASEIPVCERRADPAGVTPTCPSTPPSISEYYDNLRGVERVDPDAYRKRVPCVPMVLEGRSPSGDDLYRAAMLWIRYDNFSEHEDHLATAARWLEEYLKTAPPRRFDESARAHLVFCLASRKEFDAAVAQFDELLTKYRFRSTAEEQYGDESNVEYAGGMLLRALERAHRSSELESVARKQLAYLEQRQSDMSWRVGSEASYLLEALDDQDKKADAEKEQRSLADYFANQGKYEAAAQMWLATRRVQQLEKTDPAAAIVALEKAREAYERTGFARIYQNDLARLKLYGARAPEFEAASWVNSPPLSVEKLRGKVVVLDFWASWCLPCRRGFPALEKLYRERSKDGLVVISVTQNDGWVMTAGGKTIGRNEGHKLDWGEEISDLRQFIHDFKLTMPVAIGRRPADPKNPYASSPMEAAYGVNEYPKGVVIDREGIIRFMGDPDDPGYLQAIDRALLRQPPASSSASR